MEVETPTSAAAVPMLAPLASELRALRQRLACVNVARLQPDALVFTTARGRPHSRRNVLRAVHAAGDAAGLNGEGRERVGVHDLRHSFVALALAAGLTLPEAAALARHASPRVTAAVYAGLSDDGRASLAVSWRRRSRRDHRVTTAPLGSRSMTRRATGKARQQAFRDGRCVTRTRDPLLVRQALYQLS